MEKLRRKTKWSFHLWNVGDKKNILRHELPNFRSALSVWNNTDGNHKIEYDYELLGTKVVIERTA